MKSIISGIKSYRRAAAALLLIFSASSSFAGVGNGHEGIGNQAAAATDGNILAPTAMPFNHSLYEMAEATANFNVSDHSGPVPDTPFTILYLSANNPDNTFTVDSGNMLYIPIIYIDNSTPVIGNFPDVEDRNDLIDYVYSPDEFGMQYTKILVDGKEYSLGADYIAGVKFSQPLINGATDYIVSAAYLSPLPKGQHTVEITVKANGAAFSSPELSPYFPDGEYGFSFVYHVNVQ